MDFTDPKILNRLQKIVAGMGVAGTVVFASLFVGSIDPNTGAPESIRVNGNTIHFEHTDENAGETLVAYSDTNTRKVNVSNGVVHLALANQSGVAQEVSLKTSYKGPDFSTLGVAILTETTIERRNGTIGTRNVWLPLPAIARADSMEGEYRKKVLSEKTAMQRLEDNTFTWKMEAGDVVYFRVVFRGNTLDDRFVWEFFGSEGGYGHYDSWFGNETPETTYYAELDADNTVQQVIVADPAFINSGALGNPNDWVETDFEEIERKNFAGIDYTYDPVRDAFIPPKPRPDATLDEETGLWLTDPEAKPVASSTEPIKTR